MSPSVSLHPRHARIPNPAARSRIPAIVQWEEPAAPRPDQGSPFRGLQPRDLALLQAIVEMRYATIVQAGIVSEFANYSYAARRLRQFLGYGWVQRGQIPDVYTETSRSGIVTTRRRFHWVYSITEQGLTWLRDIDPIWAQTHSELLAPAGRPIAADRVRHELDRNTAVHHLSQIGLPESQEFQWTHGSDGAIRAYPYGLHGERLSIIPDAVVYGGAQIWLVELERSWRTTTIAKKSHQYASYFQHELWRQRFWQRPRVLFVLTDGSTQHASWQQWWAQATLLRGNTAYVVRLDDLSQPNAPFHHQDTKAPYAIHTTSWTALHTESRSTPQRSR